MERWIPPWMFKMNALNRIDPQSGEASMTSHESRDGWLVDLQSGRAVSAAWGEVEFRPLPDASIRIDAIRPADASVDLVQMIGLAMTAIGSRLKAGHLDPQRSIH
jgi:hypothetical protein